MENNGMGFILNTDNTIGWTCPVCNKKNSHLNFLCSECGNLQPSQILTGNRNEEPVTTKVKEEEEINLDTSPTEIEEDCPIKEDVDDEEIVQMYHVVLQIVGDRTVEIIKYVRDLTGKDLKESKDLVYSAPALIYKTQSETEANQIVCELLELGCFAFVVNSEGKVSELSKKETTTTDDNDMTPVDNMEPVNSDEQKEDSPYYNSSIAPFDVGEMLQAIFSLFIIVLLIFGAIWSIRFLKNAFNQIEDEVSNRLHTEWYQEYSTETITGFSWERYVMVEEFTTIKENGEKIPEGATLLETKQTFNFSEEKKRMFDVVTGVNEENKEGEESPEISLEKFTFYENGVEQKTIFCYEIENWIVDRYEKTSGTDREPYWAEPELTENQRATNYYEQLFIHMVDEEGNEYKYVCNEELWRKYEVGDVMEYNQSINGCISGDAYLVEKENYTLPE